MTESWRPLSSSALSPSSLLPFVAKTARCDNSSRHLESKHKWTTRATTRRKTALSHFSYLPWSWGESKKRILSQMRSQGCPQKTYLNDLKSALYPQHSWSVFPFTHTEDISNPRHIFVGSLDRLTGPPLTTQTSRGEAKAAVEWNGRLGPCAQSSFQHLGGGAEIGSAGVLP